MQFDERQCTICLNSCILNFFSDFYITQWFLYVLAYISGILIISFFLQTHTYIVTPSRDKEPVFEVTGLPENVEAARKEIEAHIAIRTGSGSDGFGGPANGSSGSNGGLNGFFNLNDNGSNGDSNNDMFSAPSGGLNSPFSASSGNLDHSSILNNETNGFFKSNSHSGMTLANLLDSSNNYGDLSR